MDAEGIDEVIESKTEREQLALELQNSIQNIEKEILKLQRTQKSEDPKAFLDEIKMNIIQREMLTVSSNYQLRGRTIYDITERNEESEITGGTCSLLSSLLKADNEEALKNQLNRLSLLSQNLNNHTEFNLLTQSEEDPFSRSKF